MKRKLLKKQKILCKCITRVKLNNIIDNKDNLMEMGIFDAGILKYDRKYDYITEAELL